MTVAEQTTSKPSPERQSPPRVSVVVPTHFRTDSLRALLESLRKQTFPHGRFEVIVVASENDPAFGIVEAMRAQLEGDALFDVRCVTVPDDPWKGRSASAKRNHGARTSRGEWLAFIDDDCVAHPGWIQAATLHFDDRSVGGIEGRKNIPAPPRPTVTYRGLLLFTHPGGYQTCNMFYRRDVFDRVGGFDPNFPYYLEDSDLAWSVLDAGFSLCHVVDAVVDHPVPPAKPWKMLDDARRAELMPYLFKKHPAQYRKGQTRVLRWSHWLYLALYALLLSLLIARAWWMALAVVAIVILLTLLHTIKLFRGCSFTAYELLVTALLLPVVPVVKWVQLIRGNLKHGTWLWT